MKLGKIRKQLRREFAAHPAKAAVLALLCVVALWFWAPLVWGWIAAKSPAAAVQPAVAQDPGGKGLPNSGPATISSAGPQAEPNVPGSNWHQIVQWMEQDPRMQPVGLPVASRGLVPELMADGSFQGELRPKRRDPFARPGPAETDAQDENQFVPNERPTAPLAVCPRDMGARVTGVIAGPSGGTAMINGRSYGQGEQVLLQKDGVSYAFELTSIWPWGVVLTRDGVRYELNIPLPANMPRPNISTANSTPNALP